MVISDDQLAGIIADKLGTTPDEARESLQALTAEIHQHLEKGETYRVEGLGTFNKAKSGKLQFEIDDTLRVEINYRYAGMQPIQLLEPFRSDEIASAQPESDSKIDSATEEPVEEADAVEVVSQEDSSDGVAEEPEGDEDEIGIESVDPDSELDVDRVDRPEEIMAVEPDPDARSEQAEESESATGDEEQAATEGESDIPTSGSDRKQTEIEAFIQEEEKGGREFAIYKQQHPFVPPKNPFRFVRPVVTALVLILVVFGVYVIFFSGNTKVETDDPVGNVAQNNTPAEVSAPEPVTTEQESETAPDPSPTLASPEAVAESEQPMETNQNTVSATPSTVEQEQVSSIVSDLSESTAQSNPSLYGEIDANLAAYYTLVVHSLSTREAAMAQKTAIVSKYGFKVIVKEVVRNDKATFRVGIGQFQTLELARKSISELPEPYRSNNFAARMRN